MLLRRRSGLAELDRGCVYRAFAAHEPEGVGFFDIQSLRVTPMGLVRAGRTPVDFHLRRRGIAGVDQIGLMSVHGPEPRSPEARRTTCAGEPRPPTRALDA